MSDQFWLSEGQINRIKPYFSLSHGVPRVDDRKVVSGVIHVIRIDCAGGMHHPSMVPIKPYITGSYAGCVWGCLTKYSLHWFPRVSRQTGL